MSEPIDWQDKRDGLCRLIAGGKPITLHNPNPLPIQTCHHCGLELSIVRGCQEICRHCGNSEGCED